MSAFTQDKMHPDKIYMQAAIDMARKGIAAGEPPVGAVIVQNGQIIAAEYTALLSRHDPSAHAEMLALRAAAEKVRSRYLHGAVLYTTLEPCPMCMAAAIWAKCDAVVFGARQEDALAASDPDNPAKSLRQIRIKAVDIAKAAIPRVMVFEHFMQAECIRLFDLL